MLCFWFVSLCLVYPMLPVSLDCPFVIAPSIFSSVYLQTKSKNVQQCLYQGSFLITVLVAEHEINYLICFHHKGNNSSYNLIEIG
jgi:pantothenate kinase